MDDANTAGQSQGWCLVALYGPLRHTYPRTRRPATCEGPTPGAPVGRPIKIIKQGTGAGTVSTSSVVDPETGEPGALYSCGPTCLEGATSLPESGFPTFTASAASGSTFVGWSATGIPSFSCPTSTCNFQMPSSGLPTLYATFNAVPPPANAGGSALPGISGSTFVGSTLTASQGTWTGNPTSYAYQWRRCDTNGANCSNVGTNSNSYGLTASDDGKRMRVVVTATNAGGTRRPRRATRARS